MSIKNTIQRAKNARTWMKNNRQLLLLLLAIVIMLILGGCIAGEHSAMLAMVIAGVADGKHVVDEPLTTDLANETSPGLLLNEIDQQIVKVRPMATPIDQLSRCAGSKHAGSMIVDYYNVDTKPTKTTTLQDYDEPTAQSVDDESVKAEIRTAKNEMFDVSDRLVTCRDACQAYRQAPLSSGWEERPPNSMSCRHSLRRCHARHSNFARYSRCRWNNQPCRRSPTKKWDGP